MLRLKTRAQFDAVLGTPPVAHGPHFVLHCLVLGPGKHALFETDRRPGCGPWIGAVLPKRWARRAVTRQLLRRQIERAGRQIAAGVPGNGAVAYVFRLRRDYPRSDFRSSASSQLKAAAFAEIGHLLRRAGAGLA